MGSNTLSVHPRALAAHSVFSAIFSLMYENWSFWKLAKLNYSLLYFFLSLYYFNFFLLFHVGVVFLSKKRTIIIQFKNYFIEFRIKLYTWALNNEISLWWAVLTLRMILTNHRKDCKLSFKLSANLVKEFVLDHKLWFQSWCAIFLITILHFEFGWRACNSILNRKLRFPTYISTMGRSLDSNLGSQARVQYWFVSPFRYSQPFR